MSSLNLNTFVRIKTERTGPAGMANVENRRAMGQANILNAIKDGGHIRDSGNKGESETMEEIVWAQCRTSVARQEALCRDSKKTDKL